MTQTDWQVLYVPEDPALLAALGKVAIRHGHLNHVLIRTIKTFAGLTIKEADFNLARVPMGVLRSRVEKIAREKLGEDSDAFKTLQSLLGECEHVTDFRNRLVHDLWAKELDGEPMLIGRDETIPLPSLVDIEECAEATRLLTNLINHGRLQGFIADALARKREGS